MAIRRSTTTRSRNVEGAARTRSRRSASVYAIEIEPAYVDVTVTRWEDFTGQKATRKRKRHG